MQRITVRRYKRNKDFFEVTGSNKWANLITSSKEEANNIANARRRLLKKYKKR